MTLVEFVPPTPHPLWKLCPQMGITDVIVKVNPELTGLSDPWRYETLAEIVGRLKEAGLKVIGLEGDPFDMTPIKEYGAGDDNSRVERVDRVENCCREEALAHYRELLESMARMGIKLLCYNFMVGKGWSRTGVREGRGGAKATCFSLKDFSKISTRSTCSTRFITLSDVARHFGKRIAFIHVRDVEGTKEDFTELFHDQGDTDQFALMRTYRELGLDVPVRGDHVPEMAYDRTLTPEGTPGYFTLGRLFANGYLKALLHGTNH